MKYVLGISVYIYATYPAWNPEALWFIGFLL